MKVFGALLCLFLSVNALAQSTNTSYKDTSKKFMIVDAKPINKHEKILYVIDGKPYYKISIKKHIDTNNILYVEIIKPNEALIKYGGHGKMGAVIITSKKFAISSYQDKFSAFSKEYKDYLDKHKKPDDSCSYVLNGSFLINGSNEKINKLYNIKSQEIKGIELTENPYYNGGESRKYLILINTK